MVNFFSSFFKKGINMNEDKKVKVYLDGEIICDTEKEIIIELPTSILKIKGDLIRFDNKNKIKKETGTFVCR